MVGGTYFLTMQGMIQIYLVFNNTVKKWLINFRAKEFATLGTLFDPFVNILLQLFEHGVSIFFIQIL